VHFSTLQVIGFAGCFFYLRRNLSNDWSKDLGKSGQNTLKNLGKSGQNTLKISEKAGKIQVFT
jgi:hypothetical protein